uniref:(California timema) hypothetical protein n=1 Tax=Timema californicum TaxID=61474 RepID=A0A7R9PB66_TIMCA|nr:unnamed protein product [Timema californicum]
MGYKMGTLWPWLRIFVCFVYLRIKTTEKPEIEDFHGYTSEGKFPGETWDSGITPNSGGYHQEGQRPPGDLNRRSHHSVRQGDNNSPRYQINKKERTTTSHIDTLVGTTDTTTEVADIPTENWIEGS